MRGMECWRMLSIAMGPCLVVPEMVVWWEKLLNEHLPATFCAKLGSRVCWSSAVWIVWMIVLLVVDKV